VMAPPAKLVAVLAVTELLLRPLLIVVLWVCPGSLTAEPDVDAPLMKRPSEILGVVPDTVLPLGIAAPSARCHPLETEPEAGTLKAPDKLLKIAMTPPSGTTPKPDVGALNAVAPLTATVLLNVVAPPTVFVPFKAVDPLNV